jgi:hypothetical protein
MITVQRWRDVKTYAHVICQHALAVPRMDVDDIFSDDMNRASCGGGEVSARSSSGTAYELSAPLNSLIAGLLRADANSVGRAP